MMQGSDVVDLLRALADRRISTWVGGGWAVDALVGRQTRSHDDLDLAVDADHLASVLELLAGRGFVVTVDWSPARIALATPDGRTVDLHPVAFGSDGSGIQQGHDADAFHYASDGFTTGRIDGISVPCLSAEQQLRFRTGYDLRPVDHHDVALLIQLSESP